MTLSTLCPRMQRTPLAAALFLLLPFLATSCTDAPLAPPGEVPGVGRLVVQPVFSVAQGQDTVALAAQRAAWDQLNRFRLVLRRVPSGEVVVDTVLVVTPGQQEYELGVLVPLQGAEEQFQLQLTALKDATPLFEAQAQVTVKAGGGAAAAPVPVTVQYAGPGVTAASVEVVPGGLVISPGSRGLLATRVLDAAGNQIGSVPLAWLSEAEGVARVSATGEVTGVAEGVARLVVSTPKEGVSASVWVYVVSGEVAYVTGAGDVVRAGLDGSGFTTVTTGGVGARGPAWSPDGSRLVFSVAGEVREAGGGVLLSGAFPWFSPDGSKLVVEGTRLANADGSRAKEGPSGQTPVWDVDGAHLLVGGGSIERVKADGTGRATLSAQAADRWPVVSRGGRIAFVSERDGEAALYVMEGDGSGQRRVTPAGLGVRSRAAWSPDGRFLVVSASRAGGFPPELVIVASDGGAGPVTLSVQETTEELEPAWRGAAPQRAVEPVVVSGLDPTRPLPGQEVRVLGSGFDWIIPANVRVRFPTAAGSADGTVREVLPEAVRVLVPAGVLTGDVVVEQYVGSASLAFAPSIGSLRVVGVLPWGKAVDGIGVEVAQGGSVVASGTTGADGSVTFANLYTGTYTVAVSGEPDGFHATVPAGSVTVALDATTTVNLTVSAEVRSLSLAPSSLTLAAPGDEGTVTATARDVDGDEIPGASVIWSRTNPAIIDIAASGGTVTVKALAPGSAELKAEAGAVNLLAPVVVKGAVRGTVKTSGGKAVSGSQVTLFLGETQVGQQSTGADGSFRFTGLELASFSVRVTAPRDGFAEPSPASQTAPVAEGAAEPVVAFTVRALVKQLTLSATQLVFKAPGQEQTLAADARDIDGDAIADASLAWASSDIGVVTVVAQSPSAKVTSVSPGNATVTASGDGTEATATVEVHGAVAGQVLYRYGDPFADATARLLQDGAEKTAAKSGADGRFQFEDLAAGAYVVELVPPEHFAVADSARRAAQVATGQPTPTVSYRVNPDPLRIAVTPEADTIQLNDSVTVEAKAFDARDKEIPDEEFTWASSDAQVATVRANSPTATVRGVGPGLARITATADAVSDTADILVRGAIKGVVRFTWGDPFQGATLRLSQAGAEVKPAQTTGADGAFGFIDLDPGDYSLRIDLPFGFGVDGANPRTVTVGPGLQPLDIRVIAAVQRVEISPEAPVLTVGETLDVAATAYDARDNPILQFRTVSWVSLEPSRLSAGGSTLTGRLGGVSPSATSGDAPFRIVLNGEAFDFRATVLSHIAGTVTDTAGTGVQGVTVGLGRVSDSTLVGTTATDGRGQYRFDNLYADEYAVAPVPPEGFVASPQYSLITLGPSTPKGKADFTLSPKPSKIRALILSGGHTNNNAGVLSEFSARMADIEFDTLFANTQTPTLAFLKTFNVVLLYENGLFTNSTNVGNAVYDYVEAGGNVVIGTFYWQDRSDNVRYGRAGWGALETIDPFVGPYGSEYNADRLDRSSIVPHPLTEGFDTLYVHSYHGGVTAKEGTTVLARWADGVPLLGYRTGAKGQRVVAISTFPGYVDSCCFSGDFYRLWENALRWAGAGSVASAAAAAAAAATPGSAIRGVSADAEAPRPTDGSVGGTRQPRDQPRGRWPPGFDAPDAEDEVRVPAPGESATARPASPRPHRHQWPGP